MEHEVELPSGRKIKVRMPSAADHWRSLQFLPDYSSIELSPDQLQEAATTGKLPAGASKTTPAEREAMFRAGIQLVCACSVEPRYWADLRDYDTVVANPLAVPAGYVEFDLDVADMFTAYAFLSKGIMEEAARVRPT